MASAFVGVTEREIDEYYDDFLDTEEEDVVVEDYLEDTDYDSDSLVDTLAEGYDSEDDLVFFLDDSDDEDGEDDKVLVAEDVKQPKVITPLSADTKEKMKVLDGKLRWADDDFEPTTIVRSDDDKTEYPLITDEQPKEQRLWKKSPKSPSKKQRTPMRIRVNFVKEGEPSRFCFRKRKPEKKERKGIVCKFVLDKQDCPYGDSCIYNHTIPLCNIMRDGRICPRGTLCKYTHIPTCPDSPRCKNKKCKLFHPKKEDIQKAKDQKLRFCRNVLQKAKCEYEENCKFAHSKEEVRQAATMCQHKECRLVRLTRVTNKKGVKVDMYKNTTEGRCCWRLHPNEQINNFIARTSMTSLTK